MKERQIRLLKLLAGDPGLSPKGLAEALGVEPRTVMRDLKVLRMGDDPPIRSYDRKSRRYVLSGTGLPVTVSVGEDDRLAALLAERIVRGQAGRAFSDRLARLLSQIEGPDAAEHVYVRPTALVERPEGDDRPEPFELVADLLRAIRERRAVEMTYHTASRGETRSRTVEPHCLALVGEEWMMAACDRGTDVVKDFALHRIQRHRLTGATFERRPGFRPAGHFAGRFRAVTEGPPVEVRLRFAPSAAKYLREVRHHATEEQTTEADGGLVIVMRVGVSVELRRWILGYGGECRVLGPPELRRQIVEEARRVAEQGEG